MFEKLPHGYPMVMLLSLFTAHPGTLSAGTPATASSADTTTAQPAAERQRSAVSLAASKAVHHIAQARRHLTHGADGGELALRELDSADRLLSGIGESLSSPDGGAGGEKAPWIPRDLIPIFSSLSEIGNADGLSLKRTAGDDIDPAYYPQQETGAALLYVEANLPLKSTRQQIRAAQQAIAREDYTAASQALASAMRQVVTVSFPVESPLIGARTALEQSWSDYQQGDIESAKKDISAAIPYLQLAEQSQDGTIRKGALEVVNETRALSRSGNPRDREYRNRLQAAWQRIGALADREVEYLNTARDHTDGIQAVKRNLIEAKLRIAYARIDHLILGHKPTAKVDLGEADSFLSIARTRATRAVEQRLQALSLDLADLVTSLDEAATRSAPPDYEALQAELAELIATL